MKPVAFIDADLETEFGGKSVSLGVALRAGLNVPGGFALSHRCIAAIVQNDPATIDHLYAAFGQMKTPIAVRSSAIGEDSEAASFAGQHATVLNVISFEQLKLAIIEIVESATTPSAIAYRQQLGIEVTPQMAVAMQELFIPEAAGVMFTRNPLNAIEERVIEAAWGLGEVVVAGTVIPDYYRISATGDILEKRIGEKDIELRLVAGGGTEEFDVPLEKIEARILDDKALNRLHDLALQCESLYGFGLDIEWAIAKDELVLLQCRSITTHS